MYCRTHNIIPEVVSFEHLRHVSPVGSVVRLGTNLPARLLSRNDTLTHSFDGRKGERWAVTKNRPQRSTEVVGEGLGTE